MAYENGKNLVKKRGMFKTLLLAGAFTLASCATLPPSTLGPTTTGDGASGTAGQSIHNIENSEVIQTLRRMSMGHPGVGAMLFRNMDQIYPTETVNAGRSTALPQGAPLQVQVTLDEKTMSLDEAAAAVKSNGLLVLHKGEIVYEKYFNGADATSKFNSFSMSKSVTSMLVGYAIDKGLIADVNDRVDMYLPELKGTAYDGVTVRQMLLMRSGTNYKEGYDPKKPTHLMRLFDGAMVRNKIRFTDIGKMGIKRINEPGTVYNYSTMETGILGQLVERVTGKRLAQVTEDVLWKPAGMSQSAYWLLDGNGEQGQALAGGGLNANLRDYARLGAIMLNNGRANGRQILSEGWVEQSTTPEFPEPIIVDRTRGYQYQWWTVMNSDAYEGIGIFGQFLYIDPATETVIVKTSYWPKSWVPALDVQTEKMFTAILDELSK